MPVISLRGIPERDEWILVVGGSLAETPLIRAAQASGYLVATIGNAPESPGHQISDRYINVDYSDGGAVLECAQELGIRGIVSGCNDFAALTTAYVAEELGFGGHDPFEISLRIHHKDKFRKLLEDCNLPRPRSIALHPADLVTKFLDLSFPVIVKPVDLTGGKGMTICLGPEELESAVAFAESLTRADSIIIEEYLTGSNHGYTCFIQSQKVVFEFADNEQYYLNPFLVSGTSTPAKLTPQLVGMVRDQVETLSRALKLVDGLVHVQLIATANGPFIVEVCRRCPGDLYPYFVSLSTAVDYAGAIVSFELGSVPVIHSTTHQRLITRHCVMAPRNGEFERLEINPNLQGKLVDEFNWSLAGDHITNYLVQKLAIYFLEYRDIQQMFDESNLLTELFSVRMTGSEVAHVQ